MVKNPPANASLNLRDVGSIPGSEDSLEEGMVTHSSILAGESHGQRTWWATVHGVAKSQT